MNKLNILLIIFMLIGLSFVSFAVMTKHPTEVAVSGFIIVCISSVFYALNKGE